MAEISLKPVKNTDGNGEIARYEQFLPFRTVFSKGSELKTHKNQGLFGSGLIHGITIMTVKTSCSCLRIGPCYCAI